MPCRPERIQLVNPDPLAGDYPDHASPPPGLPASESGAGGQAPADPSCPQVPVVLYWMQAAPRAWWNVALNHAAAEAGRLKVPLVCVFVLVPGFPDASLRQFWFLVQGLKSCKADLAGLGLELVVLKGDPPQVLGQAARHWQAGLVVTDQGFSLLQRQWRKELADRLDCPLVQVAGETVVPVETAYPRQAWSAAVLRRPLKNLVPGFLEDVDELPGTQGLPVWHEPDPGVPPGEAGWFPRVDLDALQTPQDLLDLLPGLSAQPGPVAGIRGGHDQAAAALEHFLDHHLHHYGTQHSDPGKDAVSGLSPWIHFGQISVLEIARRVLEHEAGDGGTRAGLPGLPGNSPLSARLFDKAVPEGGVQAFLEELLVRRDLACNFCHYNDAHRTFAALPAWAKSTLLAHAGDPRPVLHSLAELEEGATYDPVWNACQNQLRKTGTIHGYLRMYWGKKILEWSPHPEEAFDRAVYLNDKWALDGRDPNGWAGVAWCFGLHDRPWAQRPVFGTVRYMNLSGLRRKFDLKPYLDRWG